MKKMSLLILSLVFLVAIPLTSVPGRNNLYPFSSEHTSSWSFLEELLVTQPQRTVDAWFGQRGITVIASLGAAYLTYLGTAKIIGDTTKPRKIAAIGTGLGSGLLSFYALQTYLLDRAERQQITLIMKLWHQIRDRIPHEVWPMLDTLYNSYLNDTKLYESQIDETLSILKAEVYGKFPGRYKTSSESFFTSRNLSVQLRLNLYKLAKKTYNVIKDLFE